MFFGRALSLLVLLAPLLPAQIATLRGQITDESGAVVPAAEVTVSAANGQKRKAQSDAAGSYSFDSLPPGNYTVCALAPQLATRQPVTIALKPGVRVLNIQLSIPSIEEKLNVQDNAGPALSTDAANNASAIVLQGEDLEALPDDANDLQDDLQALAGPSAGPGGGALFIDGFSSGDLPPKASIREIRINQNPFSPEYDKLGYGRIEIFTKPGSDKYRAEVNYNLGTDFWNSRNPYSPSKAPFLLNEFEGDAGGPLGKRGSFTVDAQRNMVDNGSITNGITLDPNLAIVPFTTVITTPGRFTRVTPRIDYRLSDNHTLTFRYGVTHSDAQNAGIGGFDLISRGYHNQFTNQTVQAAETAVIGATVNETRFQYYRSASQMIADTTSPEVQVLGAFSGGGSLLGRSFDTQNNFELQNYTSMVRGKHIVKFGARLRGQTDDNTSPLNFNGTFIFGGGQLEPVLDANNQQAFDSSGHPELAPITSIERYRRTLLFEQMGFSPERIRTLGGGATQFSIAQGTAGLAVHQLDAGFFAGDDWRALQNLTLSFGLRYETQTNIHDWRDFAPRVAVAWAPHSGASRPKTVIRSGFGMFYDRFALANTLAAERYNGHVQQQYVVNNPDFFPNVPALASLSVSSLPQTVQEVSASLRAPYLVQSVITVERRLPANTTMAVTYTNSHGLHLFRSNDINAPLPGTFDPAGPNGGVYPFGHPGPIDLMESSGLYNQNQVITNVNTKLKSGVSLFGFYVFNHAQSNTDGISTFPANPYDFRGEYGSAATDVHHRMTVGGSINFRWNIRISPFVTAQSGIPFNVTSGSDLYGTTQYNARPAIATNSSQTGVFTRLGVFDPNPSAGEVPIPRNYGRGPALISMNLRVAKSIGFGGGEHRSSSASSSDSTRGGTGGGGGLVPAAVSGRGLGGLIGTPSTGHRYNLTLSMSIRNLLNHTNAGPIIGDITSPLFGFANQIFGAQNGEGFYETANNRKLEMQVRFAF